MNPRPHRRRATKPKEGGAKERVVAGRVESMLAARWILAPKAARKFEDPITQKRIVGFYLNTQITKTKGDRATFKANQTQSAGIPDFFVRLRHWPRFAWIGIELKSERQGAKPTEEQEYLYDDEAIYITNEDAVFWQTIVEADAVFAELTGRSLETEAPGLYP